MLEIKERHEPIPYKSYSSMHVIEKLNCCGVVQRGYCSTPITLRVESKKTSNVHGTTGN